MTTRRAVGLWDADLYGQGWKQVEASGYKTIDPSFVTEINSPPSFFPNRRFWLPIESAICPVESLNHQPDHQGKQFSDVV